MGELPAPTTETVPDEPSGKYYRSGDMSVEERRKVLESDRRCSDVEPQRVFCLMCKRHIGLHQKKDYSIVNWFKHAEACIRKSGYVSTYYHILVLNVDFKN